MKLKGDVFVAAPRDVVFDLMEREVEEDPNGPDDDVAVTVRERPRRLVMEGRDEHVRTRMAFDLVAEGTGTRLRIEMEMRPKGFLRLLTPLARRFMQKEMDAELAEMLAKAKRDAELEARAA